MRAERHDTIARLEVAHDRRCFVTDVGNLHRTPGDLRRVPRDEPYTRSLTCIEDRAKWYPKCQDGAAGRDLDGDGRAQRRICQGTRQHVTSLERPSVRVCGVG